jgi:hypothetical protein
LRTIAAMAEACGDGDAAAVACADVVVVGDVEHAPSETADAGRVKSPRRSNRHGTLTNEGFDVIQPFFAQSPRALPDGLNSGRNGRPSGAA